MLCLNGYCAKNLLVDMSCYWLFPDAAPGAALGLEAVCTHVDLFRATQGECIWLLLWSLPLWLLPANHLSLLLTPPDYRRIQCITRRSRNSRYWDGFYVR